MLSEDDTNQIIQDLIVKNENLRSHIEDLELLIMMMGQQLDGPQYEPFAESIANLVENYDES